MTNIRMFLFTFVSLVFLGIGVSAQSIVSENKKTEVGDKKPNIRSNIENYFDKIAFSGKLKILSEKKDRIFAIDESGDDIIKTLEADPKNWIEEKKHRLVGFFGHKGAIRSWRYARSPSLQITQISDGAGGWVLEIDIDKWRGFFKHLLREVIPHYINSHLKIIIAHKSTDQADIAKLIARWGN